MADRRDLKFQRLNEVAEEVDRLLHDGWEPAGNWDLAQVCQHLALAIQGSMKGIPFKAPFLVRWYARNFRLNALLRSGHMPEGVPIPKSAQPKPGGDPEKAAGRLRKAIEEFASFSDPMADHPFFGRLTKEQWARFHLIHCAHHLSFLLPKARQAEPLSPK